MNELGERLKQERHQRNMSQQDVADALYNLANEHLRINRKELPPPLTTISHWEKGKYFPSLYYRKLLCQLFAIKEGEFLVLQEKSMHENERPSSTEN